MQHTSDMDPVPNARRLKGVLAAGTAFTSEGTARERIYAGLAKSVAVRVKCSAISGTLNVELEPMLSDAGPNDTTGTAAAQ